MSTQRPRKPAQAESTRRAAGNRITRHLLGNAVGYVALFAALAGTSYAAASLQPGSVKTRALAKGAVTHSKLAQSSVRGKNLAKRSVTADAVSPSLLNSLGGGSAGANGGNGAPGGNGASGQAGRDGADGSASIVARARGTGDVTAPHGATTNIPLSSAGWRQAGNDLNLITGSMTLKTPSACTGSFGNTILLNVDGVGTTFGVAPYLPANSTVRVPIAVGPLSEPGADSPHTLTARFINSCTRAGEDFAVTDAKIYAVNFH